MERFTHRYIYGEAYASIWNIVACGENECKGPLIDRLAAYEDTELTPEAAAQLKQIAEIFNCDPNDPAQLKQLCDKLRGWRSADKDGRLKITDVEGKCGSCLHYRRREDLPAFGSCLKKPYGRDVVHDPKYPYAAVQRTRPKCKKYEEA